VFYESFDKSWKGRWIVSHKDEFTGTRWQATVDEYSVQGGGEERERESTSLNKGISRSSNLRA
jgi:hypothetical protein